VRSARGMPDSPDTTPNLRGTRIAVSKSPRFHQHAPFM
jgi:hypothetical protein